MWGSSGADRAALAANVQVLACAELSRDRTICGGELPRWVLTCSVTVLSSTWTSFVRKSAPMVALYWLENFLFTNWFINEVFPTLQQVYKGTCGCRHGG